MLPFGIQQTVELCLAAVEADPLHSLQYGYRLAMHAALGAADPHQPPATSIRPGSPAGFARRSYLRILSARFVLPYWIEQLPDDDTPQRILAACEQLIQEAEQGFISEERRKEYARQYLYDCNEVYDEDDLFSQYYRQEQIPTPGVTRSRWQYSVIAGKASRYTMYDVSNDLYNLQHGLAHLQPFQYALEADLSLTDMELDGESTDSDLWCAIAHCGVVTKPFDDSTLERFILIRERNHFFWHWWLTDAVAQAYALRPAP